LQDYLQLKIIVATLVATKKMLVAMSLATEQYQLQSYLQVENLSYIPNFITKKSHFHSQLQFKLATRKTRLHPLTS
jgi:hypothetical protein